MNIETRAIADLRPDSRNARKHGKRNLATIRASLEQFGQQRAAVIRSDGTVLAGNGMLEAARELGWTDLAVTVVPDGWSDEQARAYALADNRTGELAEWDVAVLDEHLVELEVAGLDIESLGFEPPKRDDSDDDDEVPVEVPADPVTVTGDLWQVGPHRIICGDSSDNATRMRLLGKMVPHATVTDPPYGINVNRMTLGTGKKAFARGGDWDSQRPDLSWVISAAQTCIIWGGNYFADELPVTNDWLCWHKKNDGLTFSEFELAWTNLGKNCRLLSHHWSGENKQHPTQKPMPVMTWCMSFLPESAIVFDPFTGSGSTLVAAARTGRIGYGAELDPIYVDVTVARLEAETGEKAVRVDG
jgi:DNA modification methylase